MNKWALLSFAAALVIIGCGGSGGGGSHSSTGTSGSGAPGTNLSITIGKTNAQGQIFGTADFTYLTGQGRAPGDLTAIINYVQLQDQYGVVSQSLGAQATLPLTQFTAQQLELDVPFKGQNSRLFESYTQVFSQFLVSGESTPADPPAALTFPARIRVFPGRDTEIPIFLDDSMFVDTGSDPTNSAADLIAYTYVSPPPSPQTPVNSVFAYRNLNPALATATAPAGEMGSYLGDYVGFDISAMPTAKRPQLVTSNGANGQYATQVFVSGDNFAVVAPSTPGGNAGTIQVLTLNSSTPIWGNYGPTNTIVGLPTSGTYDLTESNPSDLTGESKIISLFGAWRPYTTVTTGAGLFEFITFPSSSDNNVQELLIMQRNAAGVIQNLYYGTLDTVLGQFQSFPVADIVNASANGELDGTIGNYVGKGGGSVSSPDSIRKGTYTFPAKSPITGQSQTLPSGFQPSGTFVVFRV